jgi:hypothetical protein
MRELSGRALQKRSARGKSVTPQSRGPEGYEMDLELGKHIATIMGSGRDDVTYVSQLHARLRRLADVVAMLCEEVELLKGEKKLPPGPADESTRSEQHAQATTRKARSK